VNRRSVLAVCLLALASVAGTFAGCGGGGRKLDAPKSQPGPVPASTQRPGDPDYGYVALVNFPYITCGIPDSAYSQVVGDPPPQYLIGGRIGRNATLPYDFTSVTSKSGVKLVTANCLSCHAAFFDGRLVLGLGNSTADFTQDLSVYAEGAGAFVSGDAERAEWRKWADRVDAIAPYMMPITRGVNPAESFSAALFSHRDPVTLAWSKEPLLTPPPKWVVPLKVPPWWRVSKKNALYYHTGGRGDFARQMMTAATLCTDSVDDAETIDSYFPDIQAYITSIAPPVWSFDAIDGALAAQGKQVFEATCSRCHGTYGPGGVYPNLLVSTDEAGTDDLLAVSATTKADRFIDWYNRSYFGELGIAAPGKGYIAPPLDGVWATAPYLHNGSVPTIEALLDSPSRPQYWTRSFDSTDYDPAALGWNFTALDHGQDGEPDPSQKTLIYDTTQPGYSNQGHTFGDALSPAERAAVLEYLKTL
jgi:hypothetical protein